MKSETIKAKAELDKILKHTKFNHRTKALWLYFRGSKSVAKASKSRNKIRELIFRNLELNGALEQRLMPMCCWNCNETAATCNFKSLSHQQRVNRVKKSFRPATLADWTHAVALIDIAKEKHDQ